jgi:hypothetical protein
MEGSEGNMTVLAITVTDPAFDKKSAEVQYLDKVLGLIAQKLHSSQGTLTVSQNVIGTSCLGVPNTVVATFTHTASASNP